MERNCSGETNSSSDSQEIPCILWNPKVHYRIRNSPLSWASSTQFVPAQCTSWHILVQNPFYGYVFQVVSFIQVAHQNPVYHLSSSLYVLLAPII